jgi:putative ABC transport system permease protein
MGAPRVVIVNEAFVRRYVPDGRALGRRIVVSWSFQAPTEIVGVVGDVRHNGLRAELEPTVFLPHAQAPGYITNLVVRTTGDPAARARDIRRAVQQVDPRQSIGAVRTMDQLLDASLSQPRLYAAFLASFAGLSLLLAGIGVYGVAAYSVSQRTHELGIRLALGAPRRTVIGMVLAHGLWLALAGLALGCVAALSATRLAAGLLFGVTPTDPITYAGALATLAVLALLATFLPARRAARVDPLRALRQE